MATKDRADYRQPAVFGEARPGLAAKDHPRHRSPLTSAGAAVRSHRTAAGGAQGVMESSPQTVSRLAAAVSLSQATVTGILDRLEHKRMVKRVRDSDDKRRVMVSPTAAAEEALAGSPPLLQEHFTGRSTNCPNGSRPRSCRLCSGSSL